MNYELKQLTIYNGIDIYVMLNEIPKDENGFQNNANRKSFEEFKVGLVRSNNISKGIGLEDGLVKSITFWLYVDGKPVGIGKLRHRLVDHLYKVGGHVGYSVRPLQRGKGYGNILLQLLIEKAMVLSKI